MAYKLIILIISLLLYGCINKIEPQQRNDLNTQPEKISDSLIIHLDSFAYVYDKKEFELIKDSFPQLPNLALGIVEEPDSSLWKYKPYSDFTSFTCESCQDEFFFLYTYFLRMYTGNAYCQTRDTLINIFRDINLLHGQLVGGGTHFGHQNTRILGYAEYEIFLLMKNGEHPFLENEFIREKEKYFIDLVAFVNKVIEYDKDNLLYDDESLTKRQEYLFKIIMDLKNLITNKFYLQKIQIFEDRYYSRSNI